MQCTIEKLVDFVAQNGQQYNVSMADVVELAEGIGVDKLLKYVGGNSQAALHRFFAEGYSELYDAWFSGML